MRIYAHIREGAIVSADPGRPYLPFSALLLVAASLLAACADTRGGPIAYGQNLAPPDAPSLKTLESNYKIAPMDKLAVKVFKSEDISGEYDVDLAGHISLPLVGEVEAANMTTAELDQKLTEKLGEKYLEHPDVSVSIKQSAGRLVTIDGAVKDSGSFPVAGPLTLLQAVALAKGTSEDANPRRVAIFRTINGKRQAAAFDLTSIRRGEAQDPPIYPGDIVVVDGSSVKAMQKKILQNIPLLAIFGPL
jgi:polysaccharide biosynthesis/export protein